MFIIRNKETKKLPCEYSGDIEFPLTTGEELKNRLSGCRYSAKPELLDRFFDFENDSRHDVYSKEEYEVVEFKWCEPFYIRQSVGGRQVTFDGYGEFFFNTDEGMETIFDDEDNCIYGTDGVAIEIPAYRQNLILTLYQGRANIHFWARHEEGSSYEELEIELVRDEDGFPYWSIDSDTGGTDCDGPIEYHRFFMSHGGFAPKWNIEESQEKYERECRWYSQMISDPQRKGWNRDVYAEQAGY